MSERQDPRWEVVLRGTAPGVMLFYGFQIGHLILGSGEPGMVKLYGDGKPLFGMYAHHGVYHIPFELPFQAEHFMLTVPKGWPVFVPEGVEVVVSS